MNCKYCRQPVGESNSCACRWCLELHDRNWFEILPQISEYQVTDMAILKKKHPQFKLLYDSVLAWRPGLGKGLVAYGPPGVGKTRTVWMLLKRLFDIGVDVHALTATGFGDGISENYREGTGPAWIRSVSSHEVLFIDDLDKLVLTQRVQSELFAVVETMTSMRRSIIITANGAGQDFIRKFDPSIGAALYRRIVEFCDPISFVKI